MEEASLAAGGGGAFWCRLFGRAAGKILGGDDRL